MLTRGPHSPYPVFERIIGRVSRSADERIGGSIERSPSRTDIRGTFRSEVEDIGEEGATDESVLYGFGLG
jgi:hypothetical protein